jgi:hypothetical protein
MSEGNGWIKLHRKIFDNPVITKTPWHVTVWLYILANAAHKETDVLFSGRRFTIGPGQLVTTMAKLCSITQEERLTTRRIRTILDEFEKENQITRESRNGTGGGLLITITNWGNYQTGDSLATELINSPATVSANCHGMPTSQATARDTNCPKNENQTAGDSLTGELSTGGATVSQQFSDRQNKNIRNKENNNNNIIYNNSPATNARGREEDPQKAPEGFEYSGRDPQTGKPLYRKLNPTDEDIDAFFEYFRQHPETKIILRSEEEIKQ